MARCRWCAIEAESDDICVWCRRPLFATPGHAPVLPVMHRHQPVDNKVSFLPDAIDYTTAFPFAAGLVLIAAIAIGAGFLAQAGDGKRKVAANKIASNFQAVYSQGQDLAGDGPELTADVSASPPPARLADYGPPAPPLARSSSGVPSGQRLKSYHARAVTIQPLESKSVAVAVEPASLSYSTDLGAYVGTVSITNQFKEQIVDFSVTLDVDGASYPMMPFTGNPADPKPLVGRGIAPGGKLDCPVIAKAPEPKDNAIRSIKLTARLSNGKAVEIVVTAP